MLIRVAAVLAALAAAALLPSPALAQYKNSTMGFDAAFGINVRPPVALDDNGDQVLLNEGSRPLRLFMGGRVGAEYNYKMSADHWWLDMRINLGLWTFGGNANSTDLNEQYDAAASRLVGNILSTTGSIGIRYVILTDRVRPYVQLSLSYIHLFSFVQSADACPATICGATTDETTYAALFPHENVVGVHLQPGLEWVVAQDFALHFYVDVASWFTVNTLPVMNISPGFGVLFFM